MVVGVSWNADLNERKSGSNKPLQSYPTWHLVWTLVALTREDDLGAGLPALLHLDSKHLVHNGRRLAIRVQNLNEAMQQVCRKITRFTLNATDTRCYLPLHCSLLHGTIVQLFQGHAQRKFHRGGLLRRSLRPVTILGQTSHSTECRSIRLDGRTLVE